mgnify:CR=1 FL=1
MLNGVLLAKLEALDRVLLELKSLGRLTTQRLNEDWRTLRAVERDLQVAVETVVDVCHRIVALAGHTPPATGREVVDRCVQLGALSGADPYRKMDQFRNIVVHHYERVDPEILVDLVNNRLEDFEQFRREILAYARR